MHLSRVILDDQKRETLRLLSSLEFVHGAVEQAFEATGERRLWRLDSLMGQLCLLVLSPDKPDFTRLLEQYGKLENMAWETKAYEPLLNMLKDGQTWRFRLRANPVKSVREEDGGRGKVRAHVTSAQQKQWLQSRAEACGFHLSEDAFDVVHTQWHRFDKGRGHQVTLRTATFEGFLTISNTELLKTALTQGIGRAKAYGCGLLTLARAD